MTITKIYNKELGEQSSNRNLIICMDGTWNDETGKDGDGIITNIRKLYNSFENDSSAQISRYFRGVGNDEDNTKFGIIVGGVTGKNEKRIRDDAYSTIVKEYITGDKIFIFGFSRGAASARMLASQLNREGIPQKITITTEEKMNRTTRQIENHFVRYVSEGIKKNVDVQFLGVWDTVGAFGIPVKIMGIPFHRWNLFENMHVSPNVKRAVHLVGIDETRDPFQPTLMNYNPEVVDEIWVPGVHSDVGGGYPEDQLGCISLKLMIDRVNTFTKENSLNPLRFNHKTLENYTKCKDNIYFHFHGLGYKKSIRNIFVQKNDVSNTDNNIKPCIHNSVKMLQQSSDVYSIVTTKKEQNIFHIIYNPTNIKYLKNNYDIVD